MQPQRRRGARRAQRALLRTAQLLLLAIWASTGCGQAPAPAGAAGAPPAPLETVRQLIAAHEAGSYDRLRRLIVPERADPVINTLMAVDEFLGVNRELQRLVREQLGEAHADLIDQSYLGQNLDVFSPRVELLSEHAEGDAATVSFQSDGRVPVKRAQLIHRAGRWLYDPGPGYDPALPAAFARMARGLRLVLDDLKSGRLPRERLLDEPERLVEEVRIRLLPGVQMLPPPPAANFGP